MMKMFSTSMRSLALLLLIATSAHAQTGKLFPILLVSVVSVNPAAHTITTLGEGERRLIFTVSKETDFTDVNGWLLATGLKTKGGDTLAVAREKGYFEPKSHLSIRLDLTGEESVVAEVRFLDIEHEQGGDGKKKVGPEKPKS